MTNHRMNEILQFKNYGIQQITNMKKLDWQIINSSVDFFIMMNKSNVLCVDLSQDQGFPFRTQPFLATEQFLPPAE